MPNFDDSNNADGKNTRILALCQKIIYAWSLYDIRIAYIQNVFRFAHSLGSYPTKTIENIFWWNGQFRMHSSTQISRAGTFFMQILNILSDCQIFDFLLFPTNSES